jgi:hypothetical protein
VVVWIRKDLFMVRNDDVLIWAQWNVDLLDSLAIKYVMKKLVDRICNERWKVLKIYAWSVCCRKMEGAIRCGRLCNVWEVWSIRG